MKKLILPLFLSFPLFAGTAPTQECIDMTFKQAYYGERSARNLYDYLEKIDIDKKIKDYLLRPSLHDPYPWVPWQNLKVPHLAARKKTIFVEYLYILELYDLPFDVQPTEESWLQAFQNLFSEEGLEKMLANPKPSQETLSPEALKAALTAPRTYDESGLGAILKKNPSMVKTACLAIDTFNLEKCQSAFNYVYNNLYDSGGKTPNLGNGWLTKIATSNKAAKGGFKLVHKMIDRIRKQDFTKANLLEDAYAAFKDPNVPEAVTNKEAEDFVFLGLVHGQMTWRSFQAQEFLQPYNHATLISAFIMSVLSAPMDSMMMKQSSDQRTYVLPHGVKNVCDNGKPYHFIVPWYISSKLTEMGYNSKIATRIPFYFDWAYQAFSSSTGRSPLDNANERFDTDRNKSHRLDMLYTTIGALHGLKAEKDASYNMMSAFKKTENNVPVWARKGLDLEKPKTPEETTKAQARIALLYLQRLNQNDFFWQLNN